MPEATYRRRPEELIARYKFEPEMRDVFVEGDYDISLLQWYSRTKKTQFSIYPISTVNIEIDDDGNKGRVIELMRILNDALEPNCKAVRGLVDKDTTTILGSPPPNPLLLWSDYASMDGYCWNKEVLEKFFTVVFRRELDPKLFTSMADSLRQSFISRAAKQLLAREVSWIDFTRCCTIVNNEVSFDTAEHTSRMYTTSGKRDLIPSIQEWSAETKKTLLAEDRLYIHGHDLIALLSWVGLRLKADREVCVPGSLHRALTASVEINVFDSEPLFRTLQAWSA